MLGFISSSLKKGIEKLTKNPQLIYTVIIAILITGSFVFMAERFINIANDAEERLINVRIGSLQDAFVSFAKDKIKDTEYLDERIKNIIASNETIKSFKIIEKKTFIDKDGIAVPNSYVIIASDKKEEVNTMNNKISFLYTLASSEPDNSITVPLIGSEGERLFETARAIVGDRGEILGVVMTTQTLSLADLAIQKNIKDSRILLSGVILLILFLFFRHSRIVDYMTLYKRLKEVDQLKDDFISLASHELRTPLSIIRGYASFINEAKDLSPEIREYVTKIDVSTKDLDALVADILDVSRIEQGRMVFNLERINPKVILEEVTNSFIIPGKEKGLSVSFDSSKVGEGSYINVDVKVLKQNMVNLIGNAVKYTMKGEVVVRQYNEKGRLYIRISDTGIGMTEEERAGLFEKFYRIRNKETENVRGTGLGLWITLQMIKQMNGKISVESIKGVGSHFVVSFPLVK